MPSTPAQQVFKDGLWMSLTEILKEISAPIQTILEDVDGAEKAYQILVSKYFVSGITTPDNVSQREWEVVALYYSHTNKPYQAIFIIKNLYRSIQLFERSSGQRIHKGMPLCWLCDFFKSIKYFSIAKRYLMLTLIEDAISHKGIIDKTGGVYFRLSWQHGMSDFEIDNYFMKSYSFKSEYDSNGFFPEHVLQLLDSIWKTEIPTENEYNHFDTNIEFIDKYLRTLGSGSGKELEMFSEYLLSCIPGFKTTRRAKTKSTDYDIFCSIEGHLFDFRQEIGRYFICECKDWKRPANFSTIAKFAQVLESAKCKGGIIFSKKGLTGKGVSRDAEREILKLYQNRGVVVIIIDLKDFEDVIRGANLISMLKSKYEKIRLDLDIK